MPFREPAISAFGVVVPEDQLTVLLGEAARDLALFVENRSDSATTDDDVKALEDFAYTMNQVREGERERLRALLGSEVCNMLGWERCR